MQFRDITASDQKNFNLLARHPLQSVEWGEFRKKTGVKVIRRGLFNGDKFLDGFQLTIHKIPKTPWSIGYFPKGRMPTKAVIEELNKIGREEKCIAIQLEPHVLQSEKNEKVLKELGLRPSVHPLFTKYTFMLDITKSEEELMTTMHSKTRYNIRVAQKHGVEIVEDNSEKAFEEYIKLTEETTNRQKFYAHTTNYHRIQWGSLKREGSTDTLTSHLLVAKYHEKILASWILFVFNDTLYYPYGASSKLHREVMASNLIMWEAIRFGKKLGLQKFDMWGAANVPDPKPDNPYYGFHRFKQGYGSELIEFVGSYDLVINPFLYMLYALADKARWLLLKART